MKSSFATLVVSAALFVSITHALYYGDENVVELTGSNFDRMVINDEAIWIVQFYAAWCRHSRTLVPEYKILAQTLKGDIKVGSVNIDEDERLTDRYPIYGVPTIMIFGVNKTSPIKYKRERTVDAIAAAALTEAEKLNNIS